MTDALARFVADELAAPVLPEVGEAAARLAGADTRAILFYGSNRRTRSLEGVLDFYRLTAGGRERGLWPRVSYHELAIGSGVVRAKVATMTAATFAVAAEGGTWDTTVWSRFVQPATLVWAANDEARVATIEAVASACRTAGQIAALLDPDPAPAIDHWRALFGATYRTELRVERRGRSDSIVGHDPARWTALLPLAWRAAGIGIERSGEMLAAKLTDAQRSAWRRRWRRWRHVGKPLNIARLMRAASTFEGAARYGAWKIERHTGVTIPLTPWRERHPVLAAPGALWQVWRARR